MKALWAIALLSITPFCFGCGGQQLPPVGEVTGRITMDGNALAGASIAFVPESGRTSFAMTDADGRYELTYLDDVKGALVGRHRVIITSISPEDPEMGAPAGPPIPEKYNTKTILTAIVEPGPNTFNYKLDSRPN